MKDKGPVDVDPPVPREPLQPPEAVQPVAWVEVHDSVDVPPLATDAGDAVSDTVGAESASVVALAAADGNDEFDGVARSYADTV